MWRAFPAHRAQIRIHRLSFESQRQRFVMYNTLDDETNDHRTLLILLVGNPNKTSRGTSFKRDVVCDIRLSRMHVSGAHNFTSRQKCTSSASSHRLRSSLRSLIVPPYRQMARRPGRGRSLRSPLLPLAPCFAAARSVAPNKQSHRTTTKQRMLRPPPAHRWTRFPAMATSPLCQHPSKTWNL